MNEGFRCCEECQCCPLSGFQTLRDIAEHQIKLATDLATLKAAAQRFIRATEYPRSEYDMAFNALAALVGEGE